jgi:hypothetical protein
MRNSRYACSSSSACRLPAGKLVKQVKQVKQVSKRGELESGVSIRPYVPLIAPLIYAAGFRVLRARRAAGKRQLRARRAGGGTST